MLKWCWIFLGCVSSLVLEVELLKLPINLEFWLSLCRRDIMLNHTIRTFYEDLISLQVYLFVIKKIKPLENMYKYLVHSVFLNISPVYTCETIMLQGVVNNLDKNCTLSRYYPEQVWITWWHLMVSATIKLKALLWQSPSYCAVLLSTVCIEIY